jgi:signal transduction histidine kinase
MLTQTQPVQADLNPFWEVAAYLDEQQDAILLAWREAVERDERLTVVSKLGRAEFENSLALLLGLLSQQLRQQRTASPNLTETETQPLAANDEEEHLAQEHGFHRWQEGYDLRQLMLEMGHLNQILVRFVNEYEASQPQPQPVMAKVRILASQWLDANTLNSVDSYYRRQQAEAREIVHSLSQALQEVTEWEQRRGQVLREAVHDLRGNLSAVQGATSLLDTAALKKADGGTQEAVVGVLQRSTQTLYQMLTDLLDLARLEAGEEQLRVQDFDAAALLGEIGAALKPLAQTKGLELTGDGPSSFPVEGDALKVQRIAQNLLLNAIKYTRQGHVKLSWKAVESGSWRLSVEDTGPGLTTSSFDAATGKTQADKSGTGSGHGEGVGLAIVKRLCTLLDAQMTVESAPGVGTTFHITFPTEYRQPGEKEGKTPTETLGSGAA